MKKLNVFLMFVMLIMLVGCDRGYTVTYFEALDLSIDGLSYNEDPTINYFGSLDELKKLNCDAFEKYNDEFFKNNSLVLVSFKDYEKNAYASPSIFNGSMGFYRYVAIEKEMIDRILLLEIMGKASDIEGYYFHFNDEILQTEHVHNYVYTIVEPTCLSEGYKLYECICKDTYKDEYTEKVECKYENGECIWCKSKEPLDS